MSQEIHLPRKFNIDSAFHKVKIQQILLPDTKETILENEFNEQLKGSVISLSNGLKILVTDKQRSVPNEINEVLVTKSGEIPYTKEDLKRLNARWVLQNPLVEPSAALTEN